MRRAAPARVGGALLAALLLGAAAGCSGPAPAGAAIAVDHPSALADVPVHVRITGLAANQRVTVEASATGRGDRPWLGFVAFHADGRGVLDLATARPLPGGMYTQPEAMGLFRAMVATDGGSDPLDPPLPALQVTLRVRDGDRTLASRVVTRVYTAPGVNVRYPLPAPDGFIGHYYAPAATGPPRPAVLVFGGAEGGLSPYLDAAAALLASHGYPALTIGYFGLQGLPTALANVRLEYFAGALAWLRGQPGVDPRHVFTYGVSRGSEAALLLGAYRPDLVRGVVALVPSFAVHCAFPSCDDPSWTLNGAPLPYTTQFDPPNAAYDPAAIIPVERIAGPVLLVCGELDDVWPSCPYARAIDRRLADHADPNRHLLLAEPGADHAVGRLAAYQPDNRVTADAAGQADAWLRVLDLLANA